MTNEDDIRAPAASTAPEPLPRSTEAAFGAMLDTFRREGRTEAEFVSAVLRLAGGGGAAQGAPAAAGIAARVVEGAENVDMPTAKVPTVSSPSGAPSAKKHAATPERNVRAPPPARLPSQARSGATVRSPRSTAATETLTATVTIDVDEDEPSYCLLRDGNRVELPPGCIVLPDGQILSRSPQGAYGRHFVQGKVEGRPQPGGRTVSSPEYGEGAVSAPDGRIFVPNRRGVYVREALQRHASERSRDGRGQFRRDAVGAVEVDAEGKIGKIVSVGPGSRAPDGTGSRAAASRNAEGGPSVFAPRRGKRTKQTMRMQAGNTMLPSTSARRAMKVARKTGDRFVASRNARRGRKAALPAEMELSDDEGGFPTGDTVSHFGQGQGSDSTYLPSALASGADDTPPKARPQRAGAQKTYVVDDEESVPSAPVAANTTAAMAEDGVTVHSADDSHVQQPDTGCPKKRYIKNF